MLSSLSLNPKLWCMLCALAVAMVVAGPLRAQDDNAGEAAAVEATEEAVAEAEAADADEPAPTVESLAADLAVFQNNVNTLWTCLAAFLVFFMQAGFALVECGFTRAKNACNIIMKNLMDFSVGSLAFWLVGFGLMFGTSAAGGLIGVDGFAYDGGEDQFNWAFLIFQTVFAATAATIVSGAMAERTKFVSYLAYSVLITLVVYPIFGKWAWGSLTGDAAAGWLNTLFIGDPANEVSFYDFAGSTVVHSVGGWAALAGAIVIGPRIGKYTSDGKIKPIPGHNIPLAALGVFILWLGWFGFNPGSTTSVDSNFAFICVTTNLSAAAGSIGALITSWIMFKKPDTSFALNGALAGLVGITAGCDTIAPAWAAAVGLIAGIIVVFSCVAIDNLKIDDPVGAVSVHGVCGAWGTLAVGLVGIEKGILLGFGHEQLLAQLIGIAVGFGWAFGTSMIIFLLIKFTIGLRVPAEEEIKGLDITEHGMYAYPPHLVSESLGGTPGGSPATSTASSGAVTQGA